MERVTSKSSYVYVYAYPDGQVFYIGKGKGPRLFAHEQEARSGCECEKCQAIRGIWESGQCVQKKIVFESFSQSEVSEYEVALIQSNVGEHLLNVQDNIYLKPSAQRSLQRRGGRQEEEDKCEKVKDGLVYVSVALATDMCNIGRRQFYNFAGVLGVRCVKFPFDRKTYILKSEAERLKEHIERVRQ